jgi:hypothetical protein|tara:strand:+ start:2188 stop:2364 length:177 start_codon:yes stop_codon:yes gene_type:complete
MIKIETNQNFSNWLNIFAFGNLVEQVQGRAKAIRMAKDLALKKKQNCIFIDGEVIKVD